MISFEQGSLSRKHLSQLVSYIKLVNENLVVCAGL